MVYRAIQALSPHNDMQRTQGPGRDARYRRRSDSVIARSAVGPSISKPMLIILVSWLVMIFLGFSVLAPPNATVIVALMVSALAVSGAIFLILELDQPFGGLIGISSQPMLNALSQLQNDE